MSTPKIISLYSGAGGLDYGFEAAGFQTAVALEFDKDCCATLRLNRPDWAVIEDDINRVAPEDVLGAGGLSRGEAAVLIGGPPCQPFSKSGYWASGDSRRLADPRSSTLAAYLRVLEEALPQSFLIENVEGLGFRGKDEGLSFILDGLRDINERQGTNYTAAMRVVNAADFGVPQTRRRLLIVGSRDGWPFAFPEPTHGGALQPHVTAWDAIGGTARADNDDLAVKGKWAELLPSIPEGENYLWHTERGGGLSLFGWRRRFWNFLLKSAKDRPVWTLQAQPGPATGPFHWDNRRFSRQELAQLQTFPPGVKVTGSLAVAHRQIGNAVPSLLAEVVAREMARQYFGMAPEPPRLTVKRATAMPAARRPTPVASKYRALVGEHSAHPGTGRGFAAAKRDLESLDA